MTLADLSQWAVLIGALVPILVGVITKLHASPALKAALLLLLEGINGVMVSYFTAPQEFDWRSALLNALVAWVTGIAAYYGLLKHTVMKVVSPATASFGLGSNQESDPLETAA